MIFSDFIYLSLFLYAPVYVQYHILVILCNINVNKNSDEWKLGLLHI